ncbi:UDP-N-acetylmuramoyl-tripeptide--D-alanyl-D-alanine ligase [Alteromonas sp. 5E99-2]|uniref:UDP-N-acetylmuramoyl-tripeptide--D-alanyl-D- alanine ligase n=1 Tax=Alteromonas sp. 5E99-2 TaxID=2817683 RepID=UPI001A99EE30|nr:UDP-N-acetylmuramoyl-tripeptide--D-alanyl-D-alanine ligase [Alteromonas sp. 5E99-2]MBO1256418.1 UDP-N-acetylmuramoyl-tripeptide--D-alanyl-D-alanine ligase [Alteromonas sp. 5E99-2]
MIAQSLSWVAQQVNGVLTGEDLQIKQVSIDTRTLGDGDLYIAITGDNFNGHDFVLSAQKAGAAAAIVSEDLDVDFPTIKVEDTKVALGLLGKAVKQDVAPKTIAITGSSGKTTVKEMCASILKRRGEVLATEGNFNNDIGVPLTLLNLEPKHEYAILELGANHLGEIAYTVDLVKPNVATIVNAAASHLEGFGSLFGVARAKSEIFKGLGKNDIAIVNADSQFADFWLGKLKRQKVKQFSSTGKNGTTDFYAKDAIINLDGCAEFILCTPIGEIDVNLCLPGTHNVGNALLAAALAIEVGASLEDVRDGLASMEQVHGRLNVKQLGPNVRLLDDSYNANVASVNAAIDLLASFSGRRVLVLGDMAELGEKSKHYHEQVGRYAYENGVDTLYTMGKLSQHASEGFGEGAIHHSQLDDLMQSLQAGLAAEYRDVTILVKGSRSSKMEVVVKAIEESSLGKRDRRRERLAC